MGHTPGMPSTAASAPFTWDDFVALGDGDPRELIDEACVEVEVPTAQHEDIVGWLCFYLRSFRPKPVTALACVRRGTRCAVSERRGGMPDVQFYREGNDAGTGQRRGPRARASRCRRRIVSPSSERHDRVTKLRWYAQLGVPEYWLVHPEARTFERLVLRGGMYSIATSVAGDETFQPESFPGLEIPLAKLWA